MKVPHTDPEYQETAVSARPVVGSPSLKRTCSDSVYVSPPTTGTHWCNNSTNTPAVALVLVRSADPEAGGAGRVLGGPCGGASLDDVVVPGLQARREGPVRHEILPPPGRGRQGEHGRDSDDAKTRVGPENAFRERHGHGTGIR